MSDRGERQSLLLPILIPVGGLAVIVLVLFAFSARAAVREAERRDGRRARRGRRDHDRRGVRRVAHAA